MESRPAEENAVGAVEAGDKEGLPLLEHSANQGEPHGGVGASIPENDGAPTIGRFVMQFLCLLMQCVRLICGTRFGKASPLPFWATLLLTFAVVALAAVLNRHMFRKYDHPLQNDQHAMFSLELAANRKFFGADYHLHRTPNVKRSSGLPGVDSSRLYQVIPNNAEILDRPIWQVCEDLDSAPADYAKNLSPFMNNENSLMLLDYAILCAVPDISVSGLIYVHTLLKTACFAVFGFFLLRVGASVLMALGTLYVGMAITGMINQTHPLSLYPFLLPGTLLLIACLGLVLSYGLYRRLLSSAITAFGIGFLVAFLFNLRTSYLPVVFTLVLLHSGMAAYSAFRRTGWGYRATVTALIPPAGMLVGFMLFTAAFISPLVRIGEHLNQNQATHVVAHPLVLCLCMPDCELSRREDIFYDDAQGLVLARRIDPKIDYLDDSYEPALFVYYFKLWMFHPAEMGEAYVEKFRIAGTGALDFITNLSQSGTRQEHFLRRTCAPLRLLPNGYAYGALFGILLIAPVFTGRFLNLGAAFALSGLASVGLLLYVESGLLVSTFYLTYHSSLLFVLLLVGLLTYQLGLNAVSVLICWLYEAATIRRLGQSLPAFHSA